MDIIMPQANGQGPKYSIRLATLRDFIYQAEPLQPQKRQSGVKLPPLLEQARQLETVESFQSRREIFLAQARLLANYEDDFAYTGNPVRYYPTYQSLSDDELRGYFAWRSRIRRDGYLPGPLPFIYLHIYEILNNADRANPLAGHEALREMRHVYGEDDSHLAWYLDRWLHDYVVYYDLDPSLLGAAPEIVKDKCISVLANLAEESDASILDAIKVAAPKWLSRSRFYAEHFDDMDKVIVAVFRRMDAHYARHCKKNLVEQIFGMPNPMHYNMFGSAVFCDPLKRNDYAYRVGNQSTYRCTDGLWSLEKRLLSRTSERKLDKIIKTVDAVMRDECEYGRPIRRELGTRWLLKAIHEEIAALAAEKARTAKPELEINFASLAQIRSDAASTQEKLIVEEELEAPSHAQARSGATGLDANETRLLHALLYGGDLAWVTADGLLLSVLADSINEKLYEIFEDSVLDDSPALVEDYIENLKELIPQ